MILSVLQSRAPGLFVLPALQLRFLAYLGCAAILGFGAMYLSNLYYLHTLEEQGQQMGLHPTHVYFDFIDQQRELMRRNLVSASIVITLCIAAAGLYLSQCVIAPFRRAEKRLQQLVETGVCDLEEPGEGEDPFPGLTASVNRLVRQQHYADAAAGPAQPVDDADGK